MQRKRYKGVNRNYDRWNINSEILVNINIMLFELSLYNKMWFHFMMFWNYWCEFPMILGKSDAWCCCAFRIMVFVETISFDIQIKHDFMAFNGHSSSLSSTFCEYDINILLLIDAVKKTEKQNIGLFEIYC